MDLTPFEEIEAIESRDRALVLIRFFELVRGFVTCPDPPLAQLPTVITAAPDEEKIWLLEFLSDVRSQIAENPVQHIDAIVNLDVWLARMRGRWQVVDGDD